MKILKKLGVIVIILNFSGIIWVNASESCGSRIPDLVPVDKQHEVISFKPDLGKELTFYIQREGESLPIRYSIYKSTVFPKKGTVLFLCGGPGVPCATGRPHGVPPDFDAVTLDYLGVGAGRNNLNIKSKLLLIENQGSVAAELAHHLNEPNLIIYAQSFGTTVGTIAASKITDHRQTKTQLKGVILEGVVGPDLGKSYADGYIDAAQIAWDRLNSAEKLNFKNKYREGTTGLTAVQRRNIDAAIVMNMQEGTDSVTRFLKTVDKSFFKLAASTDYYINYINRPEIRKIMSINGCQLQSFKNRRSGNQSIFEDTVTLITIADGLEQLCKCNPAVSQYNPNFYKINVPLIYINGEQDPATPLAGAIAHMNGQTQSKFKVLISKTGGGHYDSFYSLKECMPQFFDSLLFEKIDELKESQEKISKYGCMKQQTDIKYQKSVQ